MNRILTVAIMAILAVATTTTGSGVNAQQQVPDKDCAFTPSLDKYNQTLTNNVLACSA
ncbi:MAG TPA: hypothetical protein VH796_08695 [Nitrososphaeraceae archaeon]